ncbi:putative RND superfamily drug exporter [Frankia canadensis]|uniref:Putative RND superfamily drug exporter n=1 Tax=Frankia canadensis TaxID=1836972 RepID=A0A2I2KUK7_9ACTN|nr:MMPL family transporter [Frankia canadensis]SNQ49344.1 putative RND superfamily drug exporter [Frankia canadensis]SOU56634.1 putative RND superfamily drug exporter [Frankia canadensis]
MALLVRWCQRYRWLVVAVWLVALVAGAAVAQQGGARFSQDLGVAGAESQRAMDLAATVLPSGTLPDQETIVVRARQGDVRAPEVRARVATMIAQVGRLPGVSGALDPYGPAGAIPIGGSPISADGSTALISVIMKGSPTTPDLTAVRGMITAVRSYDGPDLQVEASGPGTTMIVQSAISPWPILIAAAVALLILCLTMRSPAAVAVCAVPAVVTAVLSLSAVSLLSHRATVTPLAPLVAVVLAFGLSLGSAVVVVNRVQCGLRTGLAPVDAARAAMRHPGRATLIGSAGLAVVMLGTSLLRLNVFDGLALAGFAAAAVSLLVVATLLPAAVSVAGRGLLVWAERTQLRATGTGLPVRPGLRSWWARLIGRRPQVFAGAAVLLLVVLALPVAGLRLGGSDNGVDPTSTTTRRAYDLISKGFFPGLNGPLIAAVSGMTPAQAAAVPRLVNALDTADGVTRAFLVLRNDRNGRALIQVMATDEPRSGAVSQLVHRLRTETVPAATAGTALKVDIGGQTPLFDDMSSRFARVLPAFLALELGVLGLAVLIALRSPRHSIAVMASSLLALAATLGVLTKVFGDGRGLGHLGIEPGPIEPFILGLIMIIVFGLAIGMHLTLLSRLRGLDDAPDPLRAISSRHAEVSHIVFSVSMMMVAVFVALTTQQVRIMKLLGVGLSVGVVLDAVVVRVVLLPALVHLVRLDQPRRSVAGGSSARGRGRGRSRAGALPVNASTAAAGSAAAGSAAVAGAGDSADRATIAVPRTSRRGARPRAQASRPGAATDGARSAPLFVASSAGGRAAAGTGPPAAGMLTRRGRSGAHSAIPDSALAAGDGVDAADGLLTAGGRHSRRAARGETDPGSSRAVVDPPRRGRAARRARTGHDERPGRLGGVGGTSRPARTERERAWITAAGDDASWADEEGMWAAEPRSRPARGDGRRQRRGRRGE